MTVLRRFRWVLAGTAVALVVAVVIALAIVGYPPDPVPPPERRPATVVSMGDSLLSGEGAGDYTAGTNGRDGNWCHRSPHAAVHRLRLDGVQAAVNLACSGAPSAQVALGDTAQWTEPSQTRQLTALARTHRISAVLVAVGANDDPQLSHLMTNCIDAWVRAQPPCHQGLEPEWQHRLDAMRPKVVRALSDITSVLRTQGYQRDDYHLVQLSYPSPLSPAIPPHLRDLSGCPFHEEDLRWFHEHAADSLTTSLRRTASQAGARFLDLSDAGDRHEACTHAANPGMDMEWFTRLTIDWAGLHDEQRARHATQESFHPNASGHGQLAGCITRFLTSTHPAAACRPGPDGDLHPTTIR